MIQATTKSGSTRSTPQRTRTNTTQRKDNVPEIVDFVLRYAPYYGEFNREEIEAHCRQHLIYGTLATLRFKGKLIAMARWNWVSQDTMEILDVVVHPAHRGVRTLRAFALKVKQAIPHWNHFVYHRAKYPTRQDYGFNLMDWLKIGR